MKRIIAAAVVASLAAMTMPASAGAPKKSLANGWANGISNGTGSASMTSVNTYGAEVVAIELAK